jgi:hypothetical protein
LPAGGPAWQIPLMRPWLCVLFLVACKADGGSLVHDLPPLGPRTVSGEPDQFTPTEPGLLEVGPRGLVLAPGANAVLWARLYDSLGNDLGSASATYEVLTPDVVSVGAGSVTAVRSGIGQIRVTDGVHGEALLEVAVSADVPAGPRSIVFEPPVIVVQPGARAPVGYTLYDASGAAVGSAAVQLRIEGTTALAIDGTDVAASAPGVGTLVAVVVNGTDEIALAGSALVVAPQPDAGGNCDDVPWQVSCGRVYSPRNFYSPGLASPALRIDLVETKGCGGFQMRRRQAAPTRVEIDDGRVVSLGGGLVSGTPGSTGYRLFYDESLCDCVSAHVFPDLNGTWTASCESGDSGSVTMDNWPSTLIEAHPTGAIAAQQDGGFYRYQATSCFTGDDGFSCSSDNAPFYAGWYAFRGECTSGARCADNPAACPTVIGDCASGRNTSSDPFGIDGMTVGPDLLRQGGCEYRRGGSGLCPAPAGISFTLAGTSYQSSTVSITDYRPYEAMIGMNVDMPQGNLSFYVSPSHSGQSYDGAGVYDAMGNFDVLGYYSGTYCESRFGEQCLLRFEVLSEGAEWTGTFEADCLRPNGWEPSTECYSAPSYSECACAEETAVHASVRGQFRASAE